MLKPLGVLCFGSCASSAWNGGTIDTEGLGVECAAASKPDSYLCLMPLTYSIIIAYSGRRTPLLSTPVTSVFPVQKAWLHHQTVAGGLPYE
jgi:hypothetical protein